MTVVPSGLGFDIDDSASLLQFLLHALLVSQVFLFDSFMWEAGCGQLDYISQVCPASFELGRNKM